jgi:hypothetical protein
VNLKTLAVLREHVSSLDTQRPERLQAIRDGIRTAGRRRATAAIGGVGAGLTTVTLVVAFANQAPAATVKPSGGVQQVLAPHPFLSGRQVSWFGTHRVRLAHIRFPGLSPCIGDPRTWGPPTTRGASYTDPHPAAHPAVLNPHLNEFLLQYPSASAAHRHFRHVYRRVKRCWGGELSHPHKVLPSQVSATDQWFNEAFWGQRGDSATTHRRVVRVARAGNILIVIDDASWDDRSDVMLSSAVHKALPQYNP